MLYYVCMCSMSCINYSCTYFRKKQTKTKKVGSLSESLIWWLNVFTEMTMDLRQSCLCRLTYSETDKYWKSEQRYLDKCPFHIFSNKCAFGVFVVCTVCVATNFGWCAAFHAGKCTQICRSLWLEFMLHDYISQMI